MSATSASEAYVRQYAAYAVETQQRYGIPASVTLAQGILESANGQSQLAQREHNHFGIKATSEWVASGGKTATYSDDRPNEQFCSYASAADSYAHHAEFLKRNARYAGCFQLASDDYRGWAQGLQKAGYATNPHYAESLVQVIERCDLTRFDRMDVAEAQKLGTGQSVSSSSGQELVATAQQGLTTDDSIDTSLSADDWMKKMLSSEDSSAALQTGDPLMEMMLSLFSTLMAVAVSLDNPSRVQSQANEQANTQAQQQGQTAATVRASDLVAQHFEENLANNNTQLENIRLR
jgi:hypothetical protein